MLDIGAGIGSIQHTLLNRGVVHATDVEAASAYLKAARGEAVERGMDDRITFLHGDFVELAESIPPADIVTLDRVLCCYDDMPALVSLSAAKAIETYGLVYPRDTWLVRLFLPLANFFLSLTGTPFRIFIHRTEQIDQLVREQGLEREYHKFAGFWQVMVYSRN